HSARLSGLFERGMAISRHEFSYRNYRCRAFRPDGRRSAGERRCPGAGDRSHGITGAQISDGRARRPQSHSLRTTATISRPLWGSARRPRTRYSRFPARSAGRMVPWSRHRDIRRILAPGIPQDNEGIAALARMAETARWPWREARSEDRMEW